MTAGFGANSRAGTYYKKQEPRPRKARLLLAQPAMAEVIAQHCIVMITGNFKGFKGITPEIYGKVTANLPLYRLRCSCGHAGCLVRHGYYSRRLKTRQGTIVLRILRVRCKECGRTHAILPEIVVPYSQIPADLQQWMLLYPLGSPELESLMQKNSDISESNVLAVRSRYRRNWKERLLSMGMAIRDGIADLIRRSFSVFHRQFMQIRRGINLAVFSIHIA
jgi:hypothetical protein